MLALVLLALYTVKLWRRIAPLFARGPSLSRVGYRRALDQLAEAGLRRDYGETRDAFAGRVRSVAPTFARLTELHVAARMRDPHCPWPSGPSSMSRACARRCTRCAELGARTPLWRRLLGLTPPLTFLDSR